MKMKALFRGAVVASMGWLVVFYLLGNNEAAEAVSQMLTLIFGVAGVIYLWRD